ncbi:substrate-binding domain-containing protein, partial [Oleiphilus sp. HI0132]
ANSSDNIQPEACISIPSELYDPIKQDAILLSRANKSPAAIAFYNYLKQGKAREIIQGFSYNVPDTTLDNQHN